MSKELDKLIEQVLKEEKLPVKWSDAEIAKDNRGKRKKGFPLPDKIKSRLSIDFDDGKNSTERQAIQKLIGKDKKKTDLSTKDIEDTYKGTSTRAGTAASAAEKIRTTSTDSGLKKDIEDLYKDSNLDKAAQATATNQQKELTDQTNLYNKLINDSKSTLKSVSKLKDRFEKFNEIMTALGTSSNIRKKFSRIDPTPNRKSLAKEIFSDGFDSDELLQLSGMARASKTTGKSFPKPSGDISPVISELIKSAETARRGVEISGTQTQLGYTRYVTDKINKNGLDYFLGSATKSPNYNYTVLINGDTIEPWFLDAGDENKQKIKTLLEKEVEAGVAVYLKAFHDYTPGDKLKDKIFQRNLIVFQHAIQDLKIEVKNSAFWKAMVAKYQQATKVDPDPNPDYKRVSVTNQPFVSQAAGSGEMLESQFEMFNTFFEGTPSGKNPLNTLTQRVKKLTDFSESLYQVGEPSANVTEVINKPGGATHFNLKMNDPNKDLISGFERTKNLYVDYLNKVMVLDYFTTMAKELDSGAGPYIFEAFCAYLAGGRVAGKESGLKGGMGETDFFFDSGAKGSAKYLKKSDEFTQSVDNFLQGVTVTYVFAAKKGSKPVYDETSGELTDFEDDKEVGQSDPDLIHFIDLYVVDVTRKEQSPTDEGKVTFTISVPGTDKEYDLEVKDGQVKFKVTKFSSAGRLFLVQTSKKSITDKLETLAQEMDTDANIKLKQFEELTKNFRETFKELEIAREQVSVYSNTGEMDSGTKAKNSMDKSKTKFQKVIDIVQKGATINENINKSIDNLIESIVKKKLLK